MNTSLESGSGTVPVERLLEIRARLRRRPECGELERVALLLSGEASPDEIQEAAAHLEECPACRLTLAQFRSAEEVPRAKTPRLLRFALAGALAVAAVLVLVLVVAQQSWMGNDAQFLTKGSEDAIAIAVRRGDREFAAQPGDQLLEGDRLGFFYSSKRAGTLALFDADTDGAIGVLFPADQHKSASIEAGRERALPDGGVLRGAPRCEWVVGVFANTPLVLEELKQRIQRAIPSKDAGAPCQLQLSIPGARTVVVFPVR